MSKFDDLIREGKDTDALRMMAREMYDGGKIGNTRYLLMVRVADKLDEVKARLAESQRLERAKEKRNEMNRLTIKGFNFSRDYVASKLNNWSVAKALTKLQAYEDTGLTPEECGEIIASGKTFERVMELLKADKDGRVVVLPVPPGGECYIIDGANRIKTVHTQTYPIKVDVDGMVSPYHYFIDDIYLTREAAEAELKKGVI